MDNDEFFFSSIQNYWLIYSCNSRVTNTFSLPVTPNFTTEI